MLKAVRVDGAYTNLVLPAALGRHGVTGRDAAFATELASGTIRRRGTYDAVLGACSSRPLAKVQAKVLDVLRLGCHQLLSMRVPPHAAISTSVDLARAEVGEGAAGFTNAVLRKVAERDLDAWIRRVAPDPDRDPVGYAEVAYSHPHWIVDELTEASGRDEIDALLAADNDSPAVTLVARPGRSTRDELPGEPTRFSPYGVGSSGGDPRAVPAVAEGRAGVQDEGSQLVALALARTRSSTGATTAGSTCAPAPAARPPCWPRWPPAGAPGSSPTSCSRTAPGWCAALADRRRRCRRGDGRRRRHRAAVGPPAVFDRVLVDAPCTGLGALRRRPEARWRQQPDDLLALVLLQRGAGPLRARPGAARRRGPLRDLLAGDRGDLRAWSPRCWRAPDAELEDLEPACARRARQRRAAPRHRPAVAAPARHRRDVPGAAETPLIPWA